MNIVIPLWVLTVLIIFFLISVGYITYLYTGFNSLKTEIDLRMSGLRSRIANIEGEHVQQHNAYRDIINDITELKAIVFNQVTNTAIELDWTDITTKLKAESGGPTQEEPIQKQYQQTPSMIDHRKMKAKDKVNELAAKYPHYYVRVEGLEVIDFYRLAMLYNITDPCIQHAIKKLLALGNRGHKDRRHDINDVIDTLQSRLRIMDEDGIE
ncbi:hypothetical protein Presley_50 [Acinetobacter phage Presley]|uniref:Uncharacterized protein n=1 Tax=Acinetobacter phage Presley TaxID=1406780 RepID=U5PZP6_9CAUD|nr:hypothetical protein Presley_50 [Acinetobacter phage Presley]AGY48117.1 hypothetical protein Presley_50 [Acinetobacter phage Presley]